MSFITLTTDFGTKDHFVGAVKGAIYSQLPDAKIIDITHEVSPFSITETAYILKNSYKSFPDGTIHIVGVDSELSADNKHIALELDGHFFVCCPEQVARGRVECRRHGGRRGESIERNQLQD